MRKPHLAAALGAAALAVSSLTACSSDSDTASTASTAASDLLATTGVWADIASAVTGKDVDAVITGTDTDPHHFEPTAQDLAKVKAAGTLVANGGGYDASLYTVADQDKVIFALPPTDHDHDHSHDHGAASLDDVEHIWYNPGKVKEVADQIAQRAGGSSDAVDARMDAIEQKLAQIGHIHLAMTEPIAAGLIYGTEIHDITPNGYLHTTLNESEPSAQDVAEMVNVIESGALDFLVYNPQSTNNATDRLVQAAKEHNVPIVEMSENPPAGTDFLDYMESIVDQIAQIASHAQPHADAH